jgi:hypothetical protein
MFAGGDLLLVEKGHHRHVRRAQDEHHKLARDVGTQICRLVVHDVETRFLEGLAGLHRIRLFAFEFEKNLAFQHIAEHRPRSAGAGRCRGRRAEW